MPVTPSTKTAVTLDARRDSNGMFVIGGKPGPGRPKGCRNRLSEAFLRDLHQDWLAHGIDVLKACRERHPAVYMKVVALVVRPRAGDVEVDEFAELTPEDVLKTLQQECPEALEDLARMARQPRQQQRITRSKPR
jgi:hypothetical protein